ncbi:MAG TPA: cytochrome b [Caulobacteraceae bacterium]|nr:cytochrome b [Caulobacteraceae bacterium]
MTTQDRSAATPPPASVEAERRYSLAAILLHWTIAVLIVIQLLLGWWMNEWVPDHSHQQDEIQDWHVSLGLTILILVLVRIGVRLAVRPPPVRAEAPGWERGLINVTHSLFYILLLVLPLTGWMLVSVEPDPISWWGVTWPHLPGLGFMAHSKPLRHDLKSIHTYWLICLVLLNLALHVAGALKHQFDGHPVLARMWPGRG